MKNKLTLFTWLFVAALAFETGATMRHQCPPENLRVMPGEAPGSLNFQWNEPTTSACAQISGYEVRVRICVNNNHTTLVYYVEGSDPVMTMPFELSPGASCAWKVRSVSFRGLSTERHSTWERGPDIGTPGERLDPWDEEDVFNEAQVYPNPVFDNTMCVHINSLHRSSLLLNIVSMTGQLVHKETLPLERGSNYGDIDLSLLRAGVYFVRISDGDKTRTVKIVKL